MITVVPVRRMAPTEGKVPLRTFQYMSQVAGSVEKMAGSTVSTPASAAWTAEIFSFRPSTVAARTSTSSAAASSPSSRMMAGKPGLFSTECSAGRSSSSTADTGCGLRRITASQALRMSGKKTSALALNGSSTTVS